MSDEEQQIVYIENKPVMSYVFAVVTSFSTLNTKEVILKARGRAMSTAVDVAEITRRRYADKVEVKDILIGTEELPSEQGGTRAVSTMEIILTMGE